MSKIKKQEIQTRDQCCLYWNHGLDCTKLRRGSGRECCYLHICSHDNCRTKDDVDHRAIQHPPPSRCHGQERRLQGMNKEYPKPLAFDPRSSDNDTRDACEKYKIKKSNLNADLFEVLLRRTDINPALQASLVRGWREGLNLGSKLPETDHLVECPRMQKEQKDVLRSSIEKEAKLGRLSGPWAKPLKDGRWFKNAWVSPYFVIPKKTAPGAPTRWRLIHHLSFHKSGLRKLSLNGRIDMNEFPICFPTHMTGAHLIFCKSPTGSAVFSRDIRDFYRNFLLNPYSWWQTYSKALGSYWFNPYMPFGGSSCTSLAQR